MISFKKKLLGEKFLDELIKSHELGQKRDLVSDCQRFLKINKIKFAATFKQVKISGIPTIIVSNHYKRPLFLSKSLFTTIDSMITSTIITVSLSHLTKRKTTWVIKDNLIKNILFYEFKPRLAQISAIDVYDFIGVSQNYPFWGKSWWLARLKSGYNIALYPEGAMTTKLRDPKLGLAQILEYLAQNHIEVQILPIGVYFEDSTFKANFGKPFKYKSLDRVELEVMCRIAQNLPENLQGKWATKASVRARSQVLQQPADGQIPKLGELSEIAV